MRAINGGPAKPTDKPPRPFEEGVGGLPTLISNVETLANLPYIHRHGAQTYRASGTAASAGTFLATVTGGGGTAGLYEVPFGVSFTELLALHGLPQEKVRGVLMGGYFAGVLNREVLDTTLDHETIRGIGSGLGCGAVSVITDECPVAVAASVLDYFDRENAGQCGSCFNGTAAMAAARLRPARRNGDPRRRRSVAALVGGAARPRGVRHAGRRHQHRREPARQVPRRGRGPPGRGTWGLP